MSKERILSIALVVFIVSYISYNNYKKNKIHEDFGITGGKITAYGISGEFSSHSINYEYEVEGIKYFRGLTIHEGIDSCFTDVSKCQTYKLLVIYSNKNHSQSIINVKRVFSESIDKNDVLIDKFE